MANMVRMGLSKKVVAKIFGVSRQTVWKWCKRAKHRGRESFRDLPRRPKKRKITQKVESSIVALRTTFGWGMARIQQALFNLPKFMREKLTTCVQRICLSRTSINGVLEAYSLNGYGRERKAWKFFRAKREDELWQWLTPGIVISNFVSSISLALRSIPSETNLMRLRSDPRTTKHSSTVSDPSSIKNPLRFLASRSIRNVAEEFVNLLRKFPDWLGKIQWYRKWYNKSRFHRGINTQPAKLYTASI